MSEERPHYGTGPSRTAPPLSPEQAAAVCLQGAAPRSAAVLASILERWNDLTDAQRAKVFTLVEQLHNATVIKRAGQTMFGGGGR